MKRSMMRAGIAVGLAGIAVATGCSSDTAKRSDARAEKKTSSTTTAAFVANTKQTPGTLADFVGARTDVRDTKCAATDNGWTASGVVENPTKNPAHYRIYASFLAGDTTVGLAQTDLAKVPASKSGPWKASVAANGTDLRCVLRVERAEA